ncbi:MAG TPA: hypothetical protein DEP84_36440 [Chloroflexi bacterium]|nr:hypothetical protein [Chloroflexota bacterium]
MSHSDLCLLPITELAAQIQQQVLSPVELTEAYLARIEALDGRVESYLTITPERARADAIRAEQEIH